MAASSLSSSRRYRTIWRWHFYAGLIVAPFLLILSLTGAIYLFNDEINDALYPAMRLVSPYERSVQPSQLVRAALAEHPGTATRIDMPAAQDRSAIVFVSPAAGDPVQVAVDPGTGRVLGALVYTRTLVGAADSLHGSLMMGARGGLVMELAACWTLVLIATGFYLWWPRGRRSLAGSVYPRLRAGGRLFWRDVHATTGVWTVGLIAFLVLTGLPWAQVQGPLLQNVTNSLGIGYPASHSTSGAPVSTPMKTALGVAPWTMEGAPMPRSTKASEMPGHADHAAHEGATGAIDSDAIAGLDPIAEALARDHGLTGAYRLFPPAGPTGVYTAFTYPDRPQGQRTLYFDRYTGRLIREVAYADYGSAAKAIEIGVQLHTGNYFGIPNQIVMLTTCIAIIVLVVSGVTMWWKRRPAGQLAAPPRVSDAPVGGAIAILLVAAILFPVLGISVVVIFVIDRIVTWAAARRRTVAT